MRSLWRKNYTGRIIAGLGCSGLFSGAASQQRESTARGAEVKTLRTPSELWLFVAGGALFIQKVCFRERVKICSSEWKCCICASKRIPCCSLVRRVRARLGQAQRLERRESLSEAINFKSSGEAH
jgi:hypothetical protein